LSKIIFAQICAKIPKSLGLSSSFQLLTAYCSLSVVPATNALDFTPNPDFVKSLAIFLKEKELAEGRKGGKRKAKPALRLPTETRMTLRWIAGRLRMGSWTCVSSLLRAKP
jgi:hypothetical protein